MQLIAPVSAGSTPVDQLKAKVKEALSMEDAQVTTRALESLVPGTAATKRKAVQELVDEGVVTVSSGPRGAKLYSLARSPSDG